MKEYVRIRNELTVHLVYLQLMTSLAPKDKGGISNKTVRESLVETSEFLNKADEDEIVNKGPILINHLQKAVDWYKESFPPKIPVEQITEEFNKFFSKNREPYSWGLECGWLQKVMDCSNMGFPEDFPFHARIGIGHHAGFGSIEEGFLLRDAFFILALSEESYKNMHAYARFWKESNKTDDPKLVNKILRTANQDVATYVRLSILSFFSFVEAFVNSVGYDFSLRNKDVLSPGEIEILNGKKKWRYLSLEYKIEKIPSIIRSDKKTLILLSDSKQIKEPFKTFIENIKEIRDSSVHYSPKKEAIWRKPDDWIKEARTTSKLCLEISSKFWKTCYPDRKEPLYLNGLDYDKHINIAGKRLQLQNKYKECK